MDAARTAGTEPPEKLARECLDDPAGHSLEARLRSAERARHLGDTLFEIERHLSTAPDPADVVGLALGLASDAVGASCGSIERRELGGWVTSHTWGSSLARAGAFHSDRESPALGEMKHAGRTITLADDRSAGGSGSGSGTNGTCRVCVPLTSRGRVVGALTFCFAPGVSVSAEDVEFADRLGTMLSIWEANRITMRRHRRVAEAFQRALIDAPLTLQDLEIGHLYAPATDEEIAGGDFYDIFPIADGRVAISIGDVAGRGIEAASMTALVRDSIRVLALDGLPPADVLTKTNRVLLRFFPSEMFATVFFGIVDPATGIVVYALGGAPPPVRIDADGAPTTPGSHGPLLGVLDEIVLEQQRLDLAPGDRLVLFTNGLSEARNDKDTLGTAGILEILGASQRPDCRGLAQDIYEGVVRFAGGALRDDVAVLVIALKE